ncbi:hypothetical protein L195_g023137 [Trifolium pratense]|uniref:Uncharacterized protein n=1 Tax=Trifolium pratense TaxID=57577 RepID=A0A2K3NA23_TRIPR|nr:hypothetical protein L195_g023137 [Trifolium pratense]
MDERTMVGIGVKILRPSRFNMESLDWFIYGINLRGFGEYFRLSFNSDILGLHVLRAKFREFQVDFLGFEMKWGYQRHG